MTTQPEALRLAEWIESDMSCHGDAEIAAELRRLHIDNEAFGIHLSERMKDLAKVEAQRDALLKALKMARLMLIAHGETHAKINAAIAKAEENT